MYSVNSVSHSQSQHFARKPVIGVLTTKVALEQFPDPEKAADFVKQKGYDLQFITPENSLLGLDNKGIHYKNTQYQKKPDVIVPLILSASAKDKSESSAAFRLLKAFELLGMTTINSSQALRTAGDKMMAHLAMTKAKVDQPKTVYSPGIKHKQDNTFFSNWKNPLQTILKNMLGYGGKGVKLLPLEQAIEQANHDDLIQEFHETANPVCDYRYQVIGGKVVGVVKRTAQKANEYRANISQGGKAEMVEPNKQEAKLAIKAAKACGLSDWCGVDIIRTPEGSKVLEVNGTQLFVGDTEKLMARLLKRAVIKATLRKPWIIFQREPARTA